MYMNTFYNIISSFFPNIDLKYTAYDFPPQRENVINLDFIDYGFLNSIHNCFLPSTIIKNPLNKFQIINSVIYDNIFIDVEKKEELLNFFNQSQKYYRAFCRLAYIYKYKKARNYDMDKDLCMNPLSTLNNKSKINIYDEASKTNYQFRLSDLIKIINTALSNAPEFFSEPLQIKNPYTNIPFSKTILYNIYFAIKKSNFIMPTLFHLFFISEFNLNNFLLNNEAFIRDIVIENFVKAASSDERYYYILYMIQKHKHSTKSLIIHPQFPTYKLIETFNKHLYNFLHSLYSFNPCKRKLCRKILRKDLRRFTRLNPTYGRKIFRHRRRRNHHSIIDTLCLDISNSFNFIVPTSTTTAQNEPSARFSGNLPISPGNREMFANFYFIDTVITQTPPPSRQQRRRFNSSVTGGVFERTFVNLPYVFSEYLDISNNDSAQVFGEVINELNANISESESQSDQPEESNSDTLSSTSSLTTRQRLRNTWFNESDDGELYDGESDDDDESLPELEYNTPNVISSSPLPLPQSPNHNNDYIQSYSEEEIIENPSQIRHYHSIGTSTAENNTTSNISNTTSNIIRVIIPINPIYETISTQTGERNEEEYNSDVYYVSQNEDETYIQNSSGEEID
jgi:hypothetical protein